MSLFNLVLLLSLCWYTRIVINFVIYAGTASFYICKSGRSWHAWDNLGCTSRHYSGKDIWWQWKENPVLRVPTDNAAGRVLWNPLRKYGKKGFFSTFQINHQEPELVQQKIQNKW